MSTDNTVEVMLPEGSRVADLRRAVHALEYKHGAQALIGASKIVVKPVVLAQEEDPVTSAKRASLQEKAGGITPEGVRYADHPEVQHKPVKL